MRGCSRSACEVCVQTVLLGCVTDLLLTVIHLLAFFRHLTCDVHSLAQVRSVKKKKTSVSSPLLCMAYALAITMDATGATPPTAYPQSSELSLTRKCPVAMALGHGRPLPMGIATSAVVPNVAAREGDPSLPSSDPPVHVINATPNSAMNTVAIHGGT